MRKEDGYIGARVVVNYVSGRANVVGTIIDDECKVPYAYDFLVEFDENVGGHSGLEWGKHAGRPGHCYWFYAKHCELEEDASYCDIEISLSFANLTE